MALGGGRGLARLILEKWLVERARVEDKARVDVLELGEGRKRVGRGCSEGEG